MGSGTARRLLIKPIFYTTSATAIAAGFIYWANRPRTLPGSDSPAVPPPTTGIGRFRPPRFPLLRSREEQISRLKSSGYVAEEAAAGLSSGSGSTALQAGTAGRKNDAGDGEVYDLLIIGGGATGSGIALDATTRGLKVALVERDDFASGTSSKSTKLVHGGVRYLEKAVWELDYNQ